jgi:hypothetical protein
MPIGSPRTREQHDARHQKGLLPMAFTRRIGIVAAHLVSTGSSYR